MKTILILSATGLTVAGTPMIASAGLFDTIGNVVRGAVESNVSNPRDNPEVQREIDHLDTSREERDYSDSFNR